MNVVDVFMYNFVVDFWLLVMNVIGGILKGNLGGGVLDKKKLFVDRFLIIGDKVGVGFVMVLFVVGMVVFVVYLILGLGEKDLGVVV